MATTNGTGGAGSVEGNGSQIATAPRACSALRKACDHEVSSVVAEILKARSEAGDRSCSDAALAERLDFKSPTTVQSLRTGEAPWKLGDLLALPRSLAMEIVTALIGKIERGGITQTKDLRDHALCVSEEEGALSKTVRLATADGVLDADEQRAISLQALRLADKALDTYLAASPAAARGAR
jgi:hypothetical protein